MIPSVHVLLNLSAFIIAIVTGIGKGPLWVAVLLLAIAQLLVLLH